ncbi:9775_t:CDS:2 [Entrophospora sp. SA101]|nr:9775_t:CDS:2 [Entrophospora sp. SA101]
MILGLDGKKNEIKAALQGECINKFDRKHAYKESKHALKVM